MKSKKILLILGIVVVICLLIVILLIEKNKEEENLVKSKEYLELQKINCLNDQKKYRELMDDLNNSFDEIDI